MQKCHKTTKNTEKYCTKLYILRYQTTTYNQDFHVRACTPLNVRAHSLERELRVCNVMPGTSRLRTQFQFGG